MITTCEYARKAVWLYSKNLNKV